MGTFSELCNIRCTMKKQACFQNPNNPINLVLANIPPSFQSSSVIETGLLDFHRIAVTVMRVRFKRLQPKNKHYRKYKRFDNNVFREHLLQSSNQANSRNDCLCELEKKMYLRGNNLYFINKELSKGIINRTRLRNRFLQNKSEGNRRKYSKQRNYCASLLRETKKNVSCNLNENNVTDKKCSLLSKKIETSEKNST